MTFFRRKICALPLKLLQGSFAGHCVNYRVLLVPAAALFFGLFDFFAAAGLIRRPGKRGDISREFRSCAQFGGGAHLGETGV